MKKTGLFGGTFDPIHLGHLALAECAYEALELDELFFFPAAVPPHKNHFMFSFSDRMLLTQKAIENYPNWYVSDLDYSDTEKSYSALLIERFKHDFPDRALFFLIGADNVNQLQSWRTPEKIFELAQIVVFSRKTDNKANWLNLPYYHSLKFIDMPEIDISSTEIRQKIINHDSLNNLLPAPIIPIIQNLQKNESA